MVRATHQGVNYFPQGGPLMPGSTTAELTVYDSAKKVDGLSQTVEVDRLQSDGKQLQGITLYAITNQSQPPRTPGRRQGHLRDCSARGRRAGIGAGQGARRTAHRHRDLRPAAQKNHYLLNYPLRPGETQFQIVVSHALQRRGQLLAQAAGRCAALRGDDAQGHDLHAQRMRSSFSPWPDPQSVIMVATNVKPGQDLSFRIAGTGIFQAEIQQGGQEGGAGDSGGGAMGGSQAAANDNRPGGGLGAPIDAPDPLHEYRVYILGAFALVLVMGGAYRGFAVESSASRNCWSRSAGNG